MPLSQKTPGSSEQGSTSGVKRINRCVSSLRRCVFHSVQLHRLEAPPREKEPRHNADPAAHRVACPFR